MQQQAELEEIEKNEQKLKEWKRFQMERDGLIAPRDSYKKGSLYYDNVELTDVYKAVEKEVDELAERMVKKEHGIKPGRMGFCVYFWSCKEKILKEKYGIEWRAPNTMNPRVMFD